MKTPLFGMTANGAELPVQPGARYGGTCPIPLNKSLFEVIVAGGLGAGGCASDRRGASGRCDRRRHRDQLGELAQVLSGGGEVEFVAGAVGAT